MAQMAGHRIAKVAPVARAAPVAMAALVQATVALEEQEAMAAARVSTLAPVAQVVLAVLAVRLVRVAQTAPPAKQEDRTKPRLFGDEGHRRFGRPESSPAAAGANRHLIGATFCCPRDGGGRRSIHAVMTHHAIHLDDVEALYFAGP